ncbi:MAG: NADP-dependent isocitrate dehydrogenase [Planctomycetota bacterium]|nr:NADP-dependent isocitrate dehydrogenase [Planctomycetota bacterium]MDA1106724.1 NADP-dependent isocitrate dehydrogenase [Planctomycetota bacterium]
MPTSTQPASASAASSAHAAPTIIYTLTDEAPALATYSFLPIVQAFTAPAGIKVETRDISLAGRIIAAFPERLKSDQRIGDALAELGQLAQKPEANIIKLPNISASVPQLKAAIAELKSHGYALPEYPENPHSEEDRATRARYDAIKGSAVNPVLREGNSDRRAAKSVKEYARKNPHRLGAWSPSSPACVSHMDSGDFFGNEKSVTITAVTAARIELHRNDGTVTILKDTLTLQAGEILDGTFLSRRALVSFLEHTVADARTKGLLWSIHLKATMMKVSDPILFGHAVRAFFKPVFAKHAATLSQLGVDANNGLGDVLAKVSTLPPAQRAAIEADIQGVYDAGPAIAMVDSDRGITNLHVPSDIIIDASMPVVVRDSGQMWNAQGKLQPALCVIPDRCYAGVYSAVLDFCREHGAFDPRTMGSVPNVGLMAQKAEEYGSHDKTFLMSAAGTVRVVNGSGTMLMEHRVEEGDIWRACQTKDAPIRDWVKLAVSRARASATPAVFWLDEHRAHDREVIKKVQAELPKHDTTGLEFHTLAPAAACAFSLARMKEGKDTISVTGNVLRDYLTDLFPILELGTSAKMLSIVPLMAGGGMFETGAGGSAPKHVQQFVAENHLRWDSLGEFMALSVSFEHISATFGHAGAAILAKTLDAATEQYLLQNKAPGRKAGEPDNRATHYFVARFWAQALAAQKDDTALAALFAPVAQSLASNESSILAELASGAGEPVDLGGYFQPDVRKAAAAMRPSPLLNGIVGSITSAPVLA